MTRAHVRSLVAVLALALAACGGSGDPSGDASTGGDADTTHGQMLAAQVCATCHQSTNAADGTLSGNSMPVAGTTMVYAPNLTPDTATGLGNWTDDQIKHAIRDGVRNDGTTLCASMPHYSSAVISDADLDSLVAYLHSLPAVSHAVPATVCGQ